MAAHRLMARIASEPWRDSIFGMRLADLGRAEPLGYEE
jgi:hypothetical protein